MFADALSSSKRIFPITLIILMLFLLAIGSLNAEAATSYELRGRIVDALGIGIGGQQVDVRVYEATIVATTVTDAAGYYVFEMEAGNYQLRLARNSNRPPQNMPADFFLYTQFFSLSADTVLDLSLPLSRLDIHVQDSAGNPVANTRITTSSVSASNVTIGTLPDGSPFVANVNNSYPSYAPVTTDSSGNTTLWLIPSSTSYSIAAQPPLETDLAVKTVSVTVTGHMATSITLDQSYELRGRIVDALEVGIDGQEVAVKIGTSGTVIATTVTDAAGYYVFQMEAGSYQLSLLHNSNFASPDMPSFYSVSTQFFSLSADTVLDLSLPLSRLDIHVQDPVGNPVPNTRITTREVSSSNLAVGILPDGSPFMANVYSSYPIYAPATTDAAGNTILWLFPSSNPYKLTAEPSSSSPFLLTTAAISVQTDAQETIIQPFIHTPPVTFISLFPSPVDNDVYPGPVTASLSSTVNAGSVLDVTYYRIDGAPQQTYTDPFVVDGDGHHTIEYWSIDSAGVYETPKATAFQIASLRIVTESPLASGTIGVPYSVTLEAEGGTPPYTWSVVSGALPPGLSINATTGEISGTPTTAGTFGFTIQVMDSTQFIVTKVFTFAQPAPSGSAGENYNVPISVPEGFPSCTNYQIISGELPAGLVLDPTTGEISGTPIDGGIYTFTVQCVIDASQTATKEFTITIYNPVPTLTSLVPNERRAETDGFSLVLYGTNFVPSSVVHWDGSARTTFYVSSTELTALIFASDIATQGSAQVNVVNTTPAGGISNALTFTILPPNTPPIANDDDATTYEDTIITFSAANNDVDEDGNLDLSTISVLTSVVNGSLTNNGDGTFLYMPNANYSGSDTFTYQICDTEGECDSAVVNITIVPVNDMPIVTPTQTSVSANEGQTASNTGAVSDVDGDAVTLSASVGSIVIDEGGTWSWSFSTSDGPSESQTVLITADDGNGGSNQTGFDLVVNNVAPSVNAGEDTTIASGDAFVVNTSFTDPGIYDTHVATIDFGIGTGPVGATVNETGGSGTVNGSQQYFLPGIYTVQVCVTDKDLGHACDSLLLQVQPVQVLIDIKPGSYPNSVNLGAGGSVPVAIFSSPSFDATTLDPLTITLANASVNLRGRGTPQVSVDDVNDDGLLDLVIHVITDALQLAASDTQASLTGQTYSGVYILGTDSIRIVREDSATDSSTASSGIETEVAPEITTPMPVATLASVDSDGDGITDSIDACPDLADAGYGLDMGGCPLPPLDSDGDGLPDDMDICPSAGDMGYGLDSTGCPISPPDNDG